MRVTFDDAAERAAAGQRDGVAVVEARAVGVGNGERVACVEPSGHTYSSLISRMDFRQDLFRR